MLAAHFTCGTGSGSIWERAQVSYLRRGFGRFSPLCPPPKKSVWLLFFPNRFFSGPSAAYPQDSQLANFTIVWFTLVRCRRRATRAFDPYQFAISTPAALPGGVVEHNATWAGLRLNFRLRCGGLSTGPFRQGCRSWSGNWTGTNKLAGVTVFGDCKLFFTPSAKGGNPGKDLP